MSTEAETKEFANMTTSEQKDLVQKIGAVLKENGLEDTDVTIVTQDVCNLTNNTVDKDISLNVKKEMPAAQADLAKKVTDAIKPLVDGIKGCDISISSKVGAGDPYSTITDVMPIKGEEKINLEHKEGEVWLVDFWATWCPPCQKPMAHNQEMLEKRATDWGSNVRIIGISID